MPNFMTSCAPEVSPCAPGKWERISRTRGIDLLRLSVGRRLYLGATAVVGLTGLRNPCVQLDRLQSGLLAAVLDRDAQGNLVRKAGVMGIVLSGGKRQPTDPHRVAAGATPATGARRNRWALWYLWLRPSYAPQALVPPGLAKRAVQCCGDR
jgi:MOSC domain-containing protein YiiM